MSVGRVFMTLDEPDGGSLSFSLVSGKQEGAPTFIMFSATGITPATICVKVVIPAKAGIQN
jgi:hypothetical protein